MQQKVQFVTTVIHEPKLLIFDEPFSGFDPVNAELLKKEILELKQAGHTVIFSTHNMASVEEICDNIALINHSQVVLSGEVNEIKQRYKTNLYTIKVTVESGSAYHEQENKYYSVINMKEFPDGFVIQLKKEPELSNSELLRLLSSQFEIIRFEEELPSMNEIFINTVSQSK